MSEEFALTAEGLTKDFKGFRALDNVSLKVRRGHIHGLIGPNGAGKTTCFNLFTKFLRPTSGVIRFHGLDITGMDPADIARRGLVRSFQISATFAKLSVLQNVRVALQRKRRGDSFDFWRHRDALRALDAEAMALLEKVGLASMAQLPAAQLSYGRKRALEIATTLALEPQVLLLDEPTAGMAQDDVERTTSLIREISRGRTVLMVEHNLSVVSTLCDRLTVLTLGKVLVEGNYAEVSKDPRVVEAYLGGNDDD
ncbi:MAG: transporter ATP-binding protein [Ramlibacter sp.]|nr:transporter ATP-binding protein [Ramlibacter sp.]